MLRAKCRHFAGDNHIGGDGALLTKLVEETIALFVRLSVRAGITTLLGRRPLTDWRRQCLPSPSRLLPRVA
jgi:hypothetical protein